jgi:hypothetical protein
MLFGGGFALAADRATLRLPRSDFVARELHLRELGSVHRPVVIALSVAVVSGVALAAADFETFLGSVVFWIKLSMVALLLLNGYLLLRTETALRYPAGDPKDARFEVRRERLWRRLHLYAVLSVALWCATLVAGTVLVNAP